MSALSFLGQCLDSIFFGRSVFLEAWEKPLFILINKFDIIYFKKISLESLIKVI